MRAAAAAINAQLPSHCSCSSFVADCRLELCSSHFEVEAAALKNFTTKTLFRATAEQHVQTHDMKSTSFKSNAKHDPIKAESKGAMPSIYIMRNNDDNAWWKRLRP
jgi:hypothetical protein